MITVDGFNIKDKWKMEPSEGGLYNSIMQYYELKDRLAQDFKDTNGVVVSLTAPKAKARELSLSFICDQYAYAIAFVNYMISAKSFDLAIPDYTTDVFSLEYIGCTDFLYTTNFITFTIKVREKNPTDR